MLVAQSEFPFIYFDLQYFCSLGVGGYFILWFLTVNFLLLFSRQKHTKTKHFHSVIIHLQEIDKEGKESILWRVSAQRRGFTTTIMLFATCFSMLTSQSHRT